jgi:hypothetical protein
LFVVQHLHEEQISHLLQDGEGIGNATCPEGVPNAVNSVFYFACNHIAKYLIAAKIHKKKRLTVKGSASFSHLQCFS